MTETLYEIKKRVYEANMFLWKEGLIKLTWGNVSEVDRELGIIAIKPSGVPYDKLTIEDIVITDLDGNKEGGTLNPSSDLLTHVELYKAFSNINSVAHTHSTNAVKWAQARRDIPLYGTTHADSFYGPVPCTRNLTKQEVETQYEIETGKVIIETLKERNIDPIACPAILVYGHGPFTYGKSTKEAVENSLILEEVATMALGTEFLNSSISPIDDYLQDKHYYRKHGVNAYYGQR